MPIRLCILKDIINNILLSSEKTLYAALTAYSLIGCVSASAENGNLSSKVSSTEIGSMQYEVTCFESAEYCAEEFRRLCPAGHKVGGYFRNQFDHGQITAVITCQEDK